MIFTSTNGVATSPLPSSCDFCHLTTTGGCKMCMPHLYGVKLPFKIIDPQIWPRSDRAVWR